MIKRQQGIIFALELGVLILLFSFLVRTWIGVSASTELHKEKTSELHELPHEAKPHEIEVHEESPEHEVVHGHEEAHKPWWKIPGFAAIFPILGCFYYILALQILPRYLQKGKEEHH